MESIQIGERIRAVRKARRMTQAEMAERMGVFPPDISQIENGRRDPTFRTLLRAADALDVPLSAFFTEAKE